MYHSSNGIDGKMHKSGQHCMRNKLSPHSRAAMHGACATGGKQASRRGERGSFEGRQQQQARKMHKSVNAREINKVHGTRAGLCFPREEEEGAERAWQREHGKLTSPTSVGGCSISAGKAVQLDAATSG